MADTIDLKSMRARKARLAGKIGKTGQDVLVVITMLLIVGAVAAYGDKLVRVGYVLVGFACLSFSLYLWYKRDLVALPPNKGEGLNGRLSGDILRVLNPNKNLDTEALWLAFKNHWQGKFFINRFLLPIPETEGQINLHQVDPNTILLMAQELANEDELVLIEPGHIIAAILLTNPGIKNLLLQMQLTQADIQSGASWLNRIIKVIAAHKASAGSFGRDWTQGFTPLLSRYGKNISSYVENNGAYFESLAASKGVTTLNNILIQEPAAIALIGDSGVGKTSHVYALAQLLLNHQDKTLSDYKVISLDPGAIITGTSKPGDLEYIVMSLLREAGHAGHVIVFFDDAHLFFQSGPGSIDLTQILLPILQSRSLRLIFAMSPADFQALKATNAAFSGLLTPVVLAEPSQKHIMEVLEDTSLNFEQSHKLGITYQALLEAYRLSGRYEQESAYPGKAIKLLELSLQYPDYGVISDHSVQQAIEQTKGVKVSSAGALEAHELLNLEASIHRRMINQKRAVEVVASALRRNRAGVSNPNRPIGSFLFLGPTGVGKTELARSLSATYFRSENNLIRIDMSEYQQPDSANRLLEDGQKEAFGLISAIRQQPFSVVLLDEIEKAHPNVLNLLLQLLDEGHLTDVHGRAASFKDAIIIATSNAGAQTIRAKVEQGLDLTTFEGSFIDELIASNFFKPELLNRFDEIVLFRPLNESELGQIVVLMVNEVNTTLAHKNISVELTEKAVARVVRAGYDARLGARPMRRVLQKAVEDVVANRILSGQIQPGDHVLLDEADLALA